jgi:hypothetical protein
MQVALLGSSKTGDSIKKLREERGQAHLPDPELIKVEIVTCVERLSM